MVIILPVKTISKHGMSVGSVSFSGTAWKSLVIYNLCCWVCGPQMSGGCACSYVMAACTDDVEMPICCAIWTTCFHGDVSSIAPILSVVSSTGVLCVFSLCIYMQPVTRRSSCNCTFSARGTSGNLHPCNNLSVTLWLQLVHEVSQFWCDRK